MAVWVRADPIAVFTATPDIFGGFLVPAWFGIAPADRARLRRSRLECGVDSNPVIRVFFTIC